METQSRFDQVQSDLKEKRMLIDGLKAEINRQVAELAEQVDGDTTAFAAKMLEVSQRKDLLTKECREQEVIANELGF